MKTKIRAKHQQNDEKNTQWVAKRISLSSNLKRDIVASETVKAVLVWGIDPDKTIFKEIGDC